VTLKCQIKEFQCVDVQQELPPGEAGGEEEKGGVREETEKLWRGWVGGGGKGSCGRGHEVGRWDEGTQGHGLNGTIDHVNGEVVERGENVETGGVGKLRIGDCGLGIAGRGDGRNGLDGAGGEVGREKADDFFDDTGQGIAGVGEIMERGTMAGRMVMAAVRGAPRTRLGTRTARRLDARVGIANGSLRLAQGGVSTRGGRARQVPGRVERDGGRSGRSEP
jgi:hypothetical protein